MSNTTQLLISGFGGQGILFAGKFIAYEGLISDRMVSWLPSYGPEMRGGTANCSVILSDTEVGSPIVTSPDVLVSMNLPSLDKFENDVVAGGKIFIDSSLVGRKPGREDVDVFCIPATSLASENGIPTLANMIMMGCLIRHTGIIPYENLEPIMKKLVPAKKQELVGLNLKAINIGYNYEV